MTGATVSQKKFHFCFSWQLPVLLFPTTQCVIQSILVIMPLGVNLLQPSFILFGHHLPGWLGMGVAGGGWLWLISLEASFCLFEPGPLSPGSPVPQFSLLLSLTAGFLRAGFILLRPPLQDCREAAGTEAQSSTSGCAGPALRASGLGKGVACLSPGPGPEVNRAGSFCAIA